MQAINGAVVIGSFEQSSCIYDNPTFAGFASPVMIVWKNGQAISQEFGRDVDVICPSELTVVEVSNLGRQASMPWFGYVKIVAEDSQGNRWDGVARPWTGPFGNKPVWGNVARGDALQFDREFYPINW